MRLNILSILLFLVFSMIRVPPWSWKVMEFRKTISRAEKSWKIAKVMESHGKSWKMTIMSWNFYYSTEQFCKSDTTSFIRSNYDRFIFLAMVLRADGPVTTNSGMHS